MDKITVIGIIIGVIGVTGFVLTSEFSKTTEQDIPAKQTFEIDSFEDCANAGFPVMESYPRQCRDADGNTFIEDVGPIPTDYMITEVIDGDTVDVNGSPIRFALASAPELSEPGGVQAREFILELCPPGTFVSVDEDDGQLEGSYGRMIAVIYCEGKNLNSELLDAGLGELSTEFCGVSEFASESWAQKHGCASKTVSAPKAVPIQANCDPAYPTICLEPGIPDLDCGEITHKRFTVLPPDPHRFDGDGDGIGCES